MPKQVPCPLTHVDPLPWHVETSPQVMPIPGQHVYLSSQVFPAHVEAPLEVGVGSQSVSGTQVSVQLQVEWPLQVVPTPQVFVELQVLVPWQVTLWVQVQLPLQVALPSHVEPLLHVAP